MKERPKTKRPTGDIHELTWGCSCKSCKLELEKWSEKIRPHERAFGASLSTVTEADLPLTPGDERPPLITTADRLQYEEDFLGKSIYPISDHRKARCSHCRDHNEDCLCSHCEDERWKKRNDPTAVQDWVARPAQEQSRMWFYYRCLPHDYIPYADGAARGQLKARLFRIAKAIFPSWGHARREIQDAKNSTFEVLEVLQADGQIKCLSCGNITGVRVGCSIPRSCPFGCFGHPWIWLHTECRLEVQLNRIKPLDLSGPYFFPVEHDLLLWCALESGPRSRFAISELYSVANLYLMGSSFSEISKQVSSERKSPISDGALDRIFKHWKTTYDSKMDDDVTISIIKSS